MGKESTGNLYRGAELWGGSNQEEKRWSHEAALKGLLVSWWTEALIPRSPPKSTQTSQVLGLIRNTSGWKITSQIIRNGVWNTFFTDNLTHTHTKNTFTFLGSKMTRWPKEGTSCQQRIKIKLKLGWAQVDQIWPLPLTCGPQDLQQEDLAIVVDGSLVW